MSERRFPIKRRGVGGEVAHRPAVTRRDHSVVDGGPSEEDLERFGGVTRRCQACGKDVYDDAAVCYHCGHAMDGADRDRRSPTWIVVTVLALLGALVASAWVLTR